MSWRVLNEIYNAKGIKRRLVALTGVEPAVRQFSSVQLGLSGCRFSTVGDRKVIEHTPRIRDVLPRCWFSAHQTARETAPAPGALKRCHRINQLAKFNQLG